jgi:hypothetical protein
MRRRGGSAIGLLAILGLFGGLGVTAIVVTPRMIVGAPLGENVVAPRLSQHQAVLEALAALVGNSECLLAVHQRGPTPFVELVLWMGDRRNPGVVDADEIAVLSHSRLMRSITFYGLTADRRGPVEALPVDVGFNDSRFCDVWRSRSDVVPRVVAVGVSDMHVETRKTHSTMGPALSISLTWTGDLPDAADQGAVLVEVAFGDGKKE